VKSLHGERVQGGGGVSRVYDKVIPSENLLIFLLFFVITLKNKIT
jgi:hypothetical protein